MKSKSYILFCILSLYIAGCTSSSSTAPPKQGNFFTPRNWQVPINQDKEEAIQQIKVEPPVPKEEPQSPEEQMIGYASWYGPGFQGNKTASGEVYDQENLTAAHKLLPMDTWVEVTNMENEKKVVVRINDRGPYKKNRIIDLSQKAAETLEFKDQGTARVSLKIVEFPEDYDPKEGLEPYKQIVVQIAVFSTDERAQSFKDKLSQKYTEITFFTEVRNDKFYVFAGPYKEKTEAQKIGDNLKAEGIDNFVRSWKK